MLTRPLGELIALSPGSAVKLIVVLAYVSLVVGVGFATMRRTRTVGDFFLGGRTLGPWISAMAYGTTYFSAVLFVGFAGKLGWGFGMHVLWIAAGNALIGTFLAWAVLARPTREMTDRLDAVTMPEFLAARYAVPWLRPLAALVVFVFLVPYSASVYQGLAHLFEVNFGIDFLLAVLLMASVTGVYLVMGGYLAVTTNDFIQGLLQVFGVVLLVLLVSQAAGRGVFGCVAEGLQPAHTPGLQPKPGALVPGWVMLASLVFMTSVGPWGLPQMVQKFYSIKGRDVVVRGMIIATIFAAFVAGAAYYTGALSHHFFASAADLPQKAGGGPDFDKVVPQLLTDHAPSWFAGIVLVIVLAASMSTLAGLVLVSSAAIVVDLAGSRDRKTQSGSQGLLPMRVLCGVFVGLSVVLAARNTASIVTLMSMSWGALAGAFIGPYVWGILWRGVTPAGAVVGFVGGLVLDVGLFLHWGAANSPVGATVAMLGSLILVPLVSLVTPRLSGERVALAFGDGQPTAESDTPASG